MVRRPTRQAGPEAAHQFYPRPGKKNVSVRLGIVPSAAARRSGWSGTAKKYEYLAAVRWDKHGPLTIQVQDRKQQETVLLQVDPTTGKTTTLLDGARPGVASNLTARQCRGGCRADGEFVWLGETARGPGLELRARPDGSLADRWCPSTRA